MRCVRSLSVVVVLAFLLGGVVPVGAVDEAETDDWPNPASAPIRPGNRVTIAGGVCTSNFVFTSGTDVFLGTAAHCFTTSGSTSTNGCTAGTRPLGTPVSIQGASQQGVLVYSSWIAMKAAGEPTSSAQCNYNDFALIQIHENDVPSVSPSMRFFGGPESMTTFAGTATKVITYGNTPLRPGAGSGSTFHTHAREGFVVSGAGGGWSQIVYTVTPGLPGDSGSGVMTGDGRALGILVTLNLAPFTGANGVTNLSRALDYANTHSGMTFTLATSPLITTGLLP